MKKQIILSGLLLSQFGYGSELQRKVQAYLDNPNNGNAHYGFNSANRWLLEEVVNCSNLGHKSCTRMRVYLESYAPLMCQRDDYYSSRPRICNFFEDLLQDQKFIQGLMREHHFTEVEAQYCAKKIAEALDNAQSLV